MRDMGKLGVVAVLVIALGGCAAGASAGESDYLTNVKGVWFGTAPSDADLIAYGEDACDALTAGGDLFTTAVLPNATGTKVSVESTATDKNNWLVVGFATSLCPDEVFVSSPVAGP